MRVTRDILMLSRREGVISFFREVGQSGDLYVFDLSLERLQRIYKTPLSIFILKNGIIYSRLPRVKLVARAEKYGDKLNETEWGYELRML